MPHATVPSPGLQALILCGPGVSLNTFTANPKDFPKALVPIANRPMVWYPLDLCYRMGIHVIKLIVPPESEPALQSALKTHPALTSLPSPKPDVISPAELIQTTGTGELLRLPEVQKAIESDFIVLPCDIISELDPNRLIQQWMTLNTLAVPGNSSQQKGALAMFYPTRGLEGISTKKDETDFIATLPLDLPPVPPPPASIRSGIERLIVTMPTDTLNDKVEEGKDILKSTLQNIQNNQASKTKTKHRDSHVYIFPKWVKDFVAVNERFDSISEDVLGWWAKAAWQDGLAELLELDKVLIPKRSSNYDDEPSLDDTISEPPFVSSTKSSLPVLAPSTPSFASRVGISSPVQQAPVTIPPLHAYVQPSLPPTITLPTASHPLIRRVDTSTALLNVSLYLAKQAPAPAHPLAPEHKIHPSATIGPQTRISQEDSLIAENVIVGSRTTIKESVVGVSCEIGNNVRLTRCVLMDGVVVGDGVTLTGCTIGRRARIEGVKNVIAPKEQQEGEGTQAKGKKKRAEGDDDRTKLIDCEVAPNFVVEAGTEATGEKMMPFDTEGDLEMFANEDDDEDEDSEEEEDDEEDDDDSEEEDD